MNHRKTGRKLGRSVAHRKALFRNMVTSLLAHEQIRTTDAKAKELRGVAERMITLGKRGTLHARRQALETIRSKEVTSKLFDQLAERYRDPELLALIGIRSAARQPSMSLVREAPRHGRASVPTPA